MNIRTRLALQFLLLASLILGVSFVAVYLRAADFREEEFFTRLHDRGVNVAKLLIQVDEVDDHLLRKMELYSPVRLHEEVITIFDSRDSILFDLGLDHQCQPITPTLLDSVRQRSTILRTVGERDLYAFVFANQDERYVVVTSGHDIYGRRKLRDQANVMMIIFLLGLVLTFFVGRFFALRALMPLQRLVDDLQTIGATDLSKRIRLGNENDELAQLAASFNDLLARMQAAFLTQKNFIANASHEMRTPLTAISGQLDVLLLNPRTNEDYTTALRSVQEDVRTINKLSDRLLLLAQAETDAAVLTFNPVRMDELVWAARTEILRASPTNHVNVMIEEVEDGSDLLVNGNEVLLRSMIVNLVENACKYSTDHEATITLRGNGPMVRLVVEDSGVGIAPEDHGRIFEHFYRANNTGGTLGHGIGLSLVKRIVEVHAGSIEVRSAPGEGARFTVHLRKAG